MRPEDYTIHFTVSEGDEDKVFVESFKAFSMLLRFTTNSDADTLIPTQGKEISILVITPYCEKLLKKYLEEVLTLAYRDNVANTCLGAQRYLFVATDTNSIYFETLSRILTGFNVAKIVPYHKLLPNLFELITSASHHESISSSTLQKQIEKILPSGATELQELLFRDESIAHQLFSYVRQNLQESGKEVSEEDYALRLLLGAYDSGEINYSKLEAAIGRILGEDNFELPESLKNKLLLTESRQKSFGLGSDHQSCLADYLANRHILFIEDQLERHHWDVVLPTLFGSEKIMSSGTDKDELGRTIFSHVSSAQNALTKHSSQLVNFDIILLDLFSGGNKINTHAAHHAQTLSTLSQTVVELSDQVKHLYHDQLYNEENSNLIPKVLPQIIAFSVDNNGITARTLLKELGASDYFFKKTQGEAHKRAFYSTFRNALINALEETASHVLGIQYSNKYNKFKKWLQQFAPVDRPLVLNLMRYFRFYSARSIVITFDKYFKTTFPDYVIHPVPGEPNRTDLVRTIFSYLGRPNKSGPATLALFAKTKWAANCINNRARFGLPGDTEPPVLFKSYDQLVDSVVKKYMDKIPGDLNIILLDDMVFQGGQLCSYLWKFVNKDLRDYILRKLPTKDLSEKWKNWGEFYKLFDSKESENGIIRINAVFAIGARKPTHTCEDEEVKYLEDILEDKNVVPKGVTGTLTGTVKVRMCCNPKHTDSEGKIPCNCQKTIPVTIHIAEYNINVGEVCEREGIEIQFLRDRLLKYSYVATHRELEYPCDFEPWGWKDVGGLVATYANCPGDTLPIIWGEREKKDFIFPNGENIQADRWSPIFSRFFNPMTQGEGFKKHSLCSRAGGCKLQPQLGLFSSENKVRPCKTS